MAYTMESVGDYEIRTSKLTHALSHIDAQAPHLTYLGFAFWMAWNALAFSGTGWLRDPSYSYVIEELVYQHLLTCTIFSLVLAFASKWSMHIISKNWCTLFGGLLAAAGTTCIVAAHYIGGGEGSPTVFTVGCIGTGVGTTLLFMRGAALFGALPPRRALMMLCGSTMLGAGLFFMVSSAPKGLDSVLLALLPPLGAGFYALRSVDRYGEEQVLHEERPFNANFVLLILTFILCGFGFDLVRSYLLIGETPAVSNVSEVYAEVLILFAAGGICLALLSSHRSDLGIRNLYPIGLCFSALLLGAFVALTSGGIVPAIASKAVQIIFNVIAWSIMAYIVFRSKSNAISVFGFSNVGLCIGSLLACYISMQNFYDKISDDTIRLLAGILCVVILVMTLFVFTEKRLDSFLVPLKEPTAQPEEDQKEAEPQRLELSGEEEADEEKEADDAQDADAGGEGKRGAWMHCCEAIAYETGFTPREQVVFIQLAKGRTPQQIADHECVSIHTVRSQVRSIHLKLGVHSRAEMDELIQQRVSSENQK